MTRLLKARERAVGELLNFERLLYVPSFQRFYAWGPEEAGDLLGDIQTAQAEAARRHDEAPPCFLGCIVLVQDVGDDMAMMVDGQQRLTTLTIMLAILRDLADDGEERLGRYVLGAPAARGGPRDAVLRPRSLDRRFFYETIQTPGATLELDDETPVETEAQANMRNVALHLRREISAISPEAQIWLAEYILRRCFLVEVTAPFEDQAYRVFTVMNARGRDLKPSALLKAELLGSVPQARHVEFCDAWENLETDLGETNFVSLFSHLRMIEKPGKATKGVVAELKETLDPTAAPEAFLRKHLEPKGRILQDLMNASLNAGARTDALRPLLQSLIRLPNRDWAPPAIAFLADRRPTPQELVTFFSALERLAYGMFIQSGNETLRMSRYGKVIEKIKAKAGVDELVERMALTKNDVKIVKAVLNGTIYNKERIRGPVLLRIDQHLTDSVAHYQRREVTVEHVLPRNPPEDSPWRDSWPRAEDRRIWTDRLGNLALLSRKRNGKAGNFPFDQKKREYFHHEGAAPFALTTQVLLESEWTPEVVAARHEHLLKAACAVWALD